MSSSTGGSTHPSPDWAAVKALFDAALALPEEARREHVERAAADAAVKREVLSLLAHALASDTGSGWQATGLQGLRGLEVQEGLPAQEVLPGQLFGAWRVLRQLGAGGMGEVYEAERADGQFEGRAAIKLLKRGMDSAQVLSRFALERSALARLSHPNIARLFDAGMSPNGLPYFVMEYVEGQPIDAAARGLTLEGKLALFLQLSEAVAHAHRKLLVHRDLKPGNVLVTPDAQVKLLDFGIAKALEPDQEGATTVHSPRPFTPHYASPEQVRGEPASTSTDVYSLGVLLYELLTGVRPTGRRATSAVEAARSVLEEQPTKPSAIHTDQLPEQLRNPQWLATRRRLQGDLDNILLKSLDKSAEGRYLSVDAFAADIRAFLDGRPVSAQAPSWWYLSSRFVRRHRLAVGASALALLAILGAAGVALWQAHEAERQRAVAQARFDDVRRLAKQLVFKYHDEIFTLPGANPVREALLKDAGEFLDGLMPAAQSDTMLAADLAGTWWRLSQLQGGDPVNNLGQFQQAEQNMDKAMGLVRTYAARPELPLQSLAEAVNMHTSRAELWQARGDLSQADATLREALPLLDGGLRRGPRDNHVLASAVSLHGVRARILGNQMVSGHLGRWRDACDSADQARRAADTTAAVDPRNKYLPDTLAFTIGEQAQCRLMAGRWEEADAMFRQATELRDRMAAAMPDDSDFRFQRSTPRGQHARLLGLMGRHADARALIDEARRLAREAAAADPTNRAASRRLRGLDLFSAELHWREGNPGAARRELLGVLEAAPAGSGRRYADIIGRADALIWRARCERALGGEAGARAAAEAAREAAQLLADTPAKDDNLARQWVLGQALAEEGEGLAALGRRQEAVALAERALQAFGAGGAGAPLAPVLEPWARAARQLAGR